MAQAKRRQRRSKSNNPAGRPSNGLTEVAVLVRGPEELMAVVAERAAELGISTAEAWRRAGSTWALLMRSKVKA